MPRPLKRRRPEQGARLAALRQAVGLTQADLADRVGENQQTIARWEVAARPPPSPALPKLAKALGVSVEEILNLKSENPEARKRAPAGRLADLVDIVSAMPRRQQDRFFEFAALFIGHNKNENAVEISSSNHRR